MRGLRYFILLALALALLLAGPVFAQTDGMPIPSDGALIWLEGEDAAFTNFPGRGWRALGQVCRACSQGLMLAFPEGGAGVYDPPSYWYADFAVRPPVDGDYNHVWARIAPADARFEQILPKYGKWSLDDQKPIAVKALKLVDAGDTSDFAWIKLDSTDLDLHLVPGPRPHILHLRIQTRKPPAIRLDVIVLTTDADWHPYDSDKPEIDHSYLDDVSDYVLYTRNYLEHILPDTIPEQDELTEDLWTFATLGEDEPVTFGLYAVHPLQEVTVSVGDLVSEHGTIPADQVEVRVVRVLDKRLGVRYQPEETELVPEILDYNQPVSVMAGTSQQFWLILHVPEDTPGGTYQGIITVTPANSASKRLTLVLEVLPFHLLNPPDKIQGLDYIFQSTYNGQSKQGNKLEYMRQDLLDMKAHGVQTVTLNVPPRIEQAVDGSLVISFDQMDAAMQLLQEVGLVQNALAYQGFIRVPQRLAALGLTGQDLKKAYQQVASEILAHATQQGWPTVIFIPVDEPYNNKLKGRQFEMLATWLKEIPQAKVGASIPSLGINAGNDNLIDMRSYNGWSIDENMLRHSFADIQAELVVSGDHAGMYYNLRRTCGRPELSRVTHGLYFWHSPFEAAYTWTYQFFPENFPGSLESQRGDLAYAYPDPSRDFAPTLPTLRWEGFREGTDDVKYLYSLEMALEQTREAGNTPELVAQGEAFLSNLHATLDFYGPQAWAIMTYLHPQDYQAYRWQAARTIALLKGLPLPTGPLDDVPLLTAPNAIQIISGGAEVAVSTTQTRTQVTEQVPSDGLGRWWWVAILAVCGGLLIFGIFAWWLLHGWLKNQG